MKLLRKDGKWGSRLSLSILKKFPDDILLVEDEAELPAEVRPDKCIALVESLNSKQVLDLLISTGIRHLIQVNREDTEVELLQTAKMIANAEAFLYRPLETVLTEPALTIFHKRITCSKQKESVKTDIFESLSQNPELDLCRGPLLLIADELIMNSVFDAPRDKAGKYPNSKLPRYAEINFSDTEASEIIVARDSKSIAILSSDPFGSLNPKNLLLRLQHCYTATGNVVNLGAGGAGVGCQMMFDRSSSFYVGVKNGVRTVFCCVLPIKYRNRSKSISSKNLHIVELP